MTIEYDSKRKRATHVESGLAVEFLNFGLYAQEPDAYFELIWNDKVIKFSAVYGDAFSRMNDENPNLTAVEIRQLANEVNEMNFIAGKFDFDVKQLIRRSSEFPEIFMQVWLCVVSVLMPWYRCSVHLKPYFNPTDGEWSLQAEGPLNPLETTEGTKDEQ